MIHEIYTRDIEDSKYEKGTLETTTVLESILAKIRMVLGTEKGEVLGEYDLGAEIENYVFKSTKNANDLEKIISEQLATYVDGMDEFNIKPSVKFGHHSDGYDYAIIDINVNDVRISSYLID